MTYIISTITILLGVFCAILFFAYRHMVRVMESMPKHGITPEDTIREDLQIMQEAPLVVKVGSKYAVVKTLNIDQYDAFLRLFYAILERHRHEELFQTFLVGVEISDDNLLALKSVLLESALSRKQVLKDIMRLVYATVLKQNKISKRYFKTHATRIDLLRIFYGIRQYNIDSVKKNVSYLLAKVFQIQATGNSSKDSPTPTVGQSKKSDGPLYPEYSSLLDDEQKANTEKQKSLNDEQGVNDGGIS